MVQQKQTILRSPVNVNGIIVIKMVMGEYGRLTDKATKAIASNLDIYDKDGNLIMEKTSYYDINWGKIDSYR